ncbi:hypothetical protein HNV11_18685 [Spirosoma taeanense]|uniref:Uncharacterized protein n=1 Tax=Spirosoma taeanense TaxID=2735870 RepID=A0A6M5YD64_9BACT|nr:hypothetical protein [Spirosoma taeanense]QJW91256.1 hypothetical protein HNV11_18685 [Spirosoma taeanense]
MKTKRLLTNTDRIIFRNAFLKNNGTSIKTDYLQNSEVWGCYLNDHLVAGFIINRTLPLRYLEHFSEAFGQELLRSHQLNNVTEVTCIWHARDRPFPVFAKAELYLQSVLKAVTWQSWLANTTILGGSFEAKVARRQRTLLCHLLFQETIEVNGQLKNAQLYYAHAQLVVFRFPIAISRMLIEEIKKSLSTRIQQLQKQWRQLIFNFLTKSRKVTPKNS